MRATGGRTLLGGRRKARRAWRECTGTMAKLTIEEIGVHLLARSVVGVQEGKVVVVYVHVGRKAPYERLAYDQWDADALLARRHRAGFARERWNASPATRESRAALLRFGRAREGCKCRGFPRTLNPTLGLTCTVRVTAAITPAR